MIVEAHMSLGGKLLAARLRETKVIFGSAIGQTTGDKTANPA
jgi:hypothetical protein